jgi:putative membrane protein
MRGFVLVALISLLVFDCMTLAAVADDKGLTAAEKTFVKNAASSCNMEVQLGKAAQQKGVAQEVRHFGETMVTDHGKAAEQLNVLASQNNLLLPAQLERRHLVTVDELLELSGSKFDKKYLAAMVTNHKKDVAMFRRAFKKVKEPALKQWIGKTLPLLEMHLAMARDTAQKVAARMK